MGFMSWKEVNCIRFVEYFDFVSCYCFVVDVVYV